MKYQILFFCLILIQCNSSSFSGSSKNKEKKIVTEAKEVVIDTTNQNGQVEDPVSKPEPEDTPLPKCFKEPIPLPEQMTEPKELWIWHASGSTSSYRQVMATPVVGYLISKSIPSVVAPAFQGGGYTSPGYLYAINGADGSQQWIGEVQVYPGASAAIGDVDGDGKNEVAVVGCSDNGTPACGESYVYLLDGDTGKIKTINGKAWKSAEQALDLQISLADVDEDSFVEVISAGKVFDGLTGQLKFAASDGSAITVDVSEESGIELITAAGIFSGKTGAKICGFSTSIAYPAAARARKTDDFFTIIGRNGSNVVAYKSSTSVGDTCEQVFNVVFPGGGGGPFNMADFDGDKELEVGSAGASAYAVFKMDGTILWADYATSDVSSAATGSTAFDFNGDGLAEVVYNDEYHLRVYDGRGEGGKAIIRYEIANSSGTIIENPVVVDVDGDGHAEIVVASNNYAWGDPNHYGVRVFKAPNNDWIGTRPIWNQHPYYVLNVKDSGKLINIDKNAIWKEWISDEYLLGFRNNLPIRPLKEVCE